MKLSGSNTLAISPRLIINAAGPWIDRTNRILGLPTQYVGPTKGSHLVLDNPELRAAIGDHEFFFENKDGRIVLIFPLFDKVMIGTSDLPIEDPDSARCTEEEVDYFIEMVGRVFPGIKVSVSRSFSASRVSARWRIPKPKMPGRSRATTTSRKTNWGISRSTRWWAANGPRSALSPNKLPTGPWLS